MCKIYIFVFTILFSFYANALQVSDQIKTSLGSCYDIGDKLQNCQQSSCVRSFPEIDGAWYTIIIKGLNKNNNCYTVSYAFQNDKVISDVEHCWYNTAQLSQASMQAKHMQNAESAFDYTNADNLWRKLRNDICKNVSLSHK